MTLGAAVRQEERVCWKAASKKGAQARKGGTRLCRASMGTHALRVGSGASPMGDNCRPLSTHDRFNFRKGTRVGSVGPPDPEP